jgi:hypothetical protein
VSGKGRTWYLQGQSLHESVYNSHVRFDLLPQGQHFSETKICHCNFRSTCRWWPSVALPKLGSNFTTARKLSTGSLICATCSLISCPYSADLFKAVKACSVRASDLGLEGKIQPRGNFQRRRQRCLAPGSALHTSVTAAAISPADHPKDMAGHY